MAYTSTNAALAALGMKAKDIQVLTTPQKTGIMKMLDNVNPGLQQSNNIPASGGGGPNMTAATTEGAWRPSAGDTMSGNYEGFNDKILDTIQTFVLEDDNWLMGLATQVDASTGTLTWSFTEFSPKIPSQVPPRSRVRLLGMRRGSGKAKMTRKGIGAEFDLETLEQGVPRGIENFLAQLTNINLSVVEGLKIDLMWQIMTAALTHPMHINERIVSAWKVRGLLDHENRTIFSVLSNKMCTQLWYELFKQQQRAMGVASETELHSWIMHYHTALRLHLDNGLVQQFQLQGLADNPFKVDAASAWSSIQGEPVFLARPFYNAEGEYDPMLMHSSYGLDYTFFDVSRIWPEKKWTPSMNIMTVPDFNIGSTFVVEYKNMLANSERFDPVTGNARSLADWQSWGAVTPDQYSRIPRGKQDDFHPVGSDIAALVIGSASGFSGGRALHMVRAFLQTRESLLADLNALIAQIEEIAGYMENTSIDPPLLGAIRNIKAAKTPDSVVGLRPSEQALQQLPQSASLKFVVPDPNLLAAIKDKDYPPLFASGGGFQFLSKHGTDATKEEYAEIMKEARDIASRLGAFAPTLAMDTRYSANGIFNSDAAILLIDAILPHRPNLFVAENNAGEFGEVYQSAIGHYDALVQKYAGLVQPDASNYKAAFVVYALLYSFQQTHKLDPKKAADRIKLIVDGVKQILTANAANPQQAGQMTVELLEQHSERKFGDKLPGYLDELARLNDARDGVSAGKMARTPFRVGPNQLADLIKYNTTNNGAFVTVQRLGEFDQPAQTSELATYDKQVKNPGDATQFYPQGMPIGRRTMLFQKAGHRIADAATRALRPVPAGSALIGAGGAGGGAGTASVSASSGFMDLWGGSGSTAAAQSAEQERRKYVHAAQAAIGVADPRAGDIVTAEYIKAFNQIGMKATDDAHAVLARMLLTLPLNENALVSAFEGGLPPVLEGHHLTVLESTTYPVLRLAPGPQTLIWSQKHKMLNWGVNSQTHMLGIYLTYYTGTASPEPRRTQGIMAVDPVEWKKGSAGHFVSGRTFATQQNTGGLLPVLYFAPDDPSVGEHYFSLTGGVALGNSAVSIDVLDLPNNVSQFEQIRTGAMHHNSAGKPDKIKPPMVLGIVNQSSATTPVFTRSTSRFATDLYTESHSAIPTGFHGPKAKSNLFFVINEPTVSVHAGDGK